MDGSIASHATVSGALLNELLSGQYPQREKPKSAWAIQWGGEDYLWRVMNMGSKHGCGGADLLATVTEMTARLVAQAVGKLPERPHEVILSGGGALNIHLAGRIRKLLSPSSTYAVERYGLSLRAYRAACYAVLAAARLDEYPAHCGQGGSGEGPAVLGSVTLP